MLKLKGKIKKDWSPHKYLVASARKVWGWSPLRNSVLKRSQIDKDSWKCEVCLKIVTKIVYFTKKGRKKRRINGAIDHIVPIGKQPKSFEEYPDYYKRLFCEVSNYQFLCKSCHDKKSEKEKKLRVQARRLQKKRLAILAQTRTL